MSVEVDTTAVKKLEKNLSVKPPKMYKVIYMNDDVTTAEFVIETLESVFNYNTEEAEITTMEIHNAGSAVVAVLPYEIAEQKGVEVTMLARNKGFPLQIRLEAE